MSSALENGLIIFSIIFFSLIFFSKRLRNSQTWLATVTPLASIIGSGFLVSAPLLILTTGKWAPVAMIVIASIAFLLGGAMRFNILHLEPLLEEKNKSRFVIKLEIISRPILGVAYIISAAFYLKLLSAFLLRGFNINDPILENIVTTSILSFIAITGWVRGLNMLEIFEAYAVNVKLIIICSMILGHLFFNGNLWFHDSWSLTEHAHFTAFETAQKLLGILIIIQGFETSRYLGQIYTPEMRIKSMRYAQLISGAIYILFVSSAMVLFNNIHEVTEIATIELCRIIAPILPFFLIIAAILSQFSAAIADTLGSAGLISEATKKTVSMKLGIINVCIVGIVLTWLTNIYQIITLASKAFAIYYAIQCMISANLVFKLENQRGKIIKLCVYLSLIFLMIQVVIFGSPVE